MMTATETTCPKCGSGNFGVKGPEPVTVNGWYGGVEVMWGHVGSVRVPRVVAKRCEDCGHREPVDPGFGR